METTKNFLGSHVFCTPQEGMEHANMYHSDNINCQQWNGPFLLVFAYA